VNKIWPIGRIAVALVLNLACTSVSNAQARPLTNLRAEKLIVARPQYDYSVSPMFDGKYRMWWCGENYPAIAGDNIFYSEAPALAGPWSTPISVFHSTQVDGTFDKAHTCDPSVVRVKGTYYLYYGGRNLQETRYGCAADEWGTGRIGVASSSDGIHWTRMNGGNAIVNPLYPFLGCHYGAGQPSVAYVAPHFYMIYTDTTHVGGTVSVPGQYVIRSADPTFASGVESLKLGSGNPYWSTSPPGANDLNVFQGHSVEIAFSDITNGFALVNQWAGRLTSKTFQWVENLQFPADPNTSFCDSGLLRTPEGHLPPSRTNLTNLSFDLVYPKAVIGQCAHISGNKNDVGNYDIAWSGGDLPSNMSISQLNATGRMAALLEGFRVSSAGRPDLLVKNGKGLRFSYEPVSTLVTHSSINVSSDAYAGIPLGPVISTGMRVLNGPPNQPSAFVPGDGNRWHIGCQDMIQRNASSPVTSNSEYWGLFGAGDLHCLQSTNPPFGFLDAAAPAVNGVVISGWSMDPDDPGASVRIVATVTRNGQTQTNSVGLANQYRADVASNRPDTDGYQGFSGGFSCNLAFGTSTVCASALSTDLGPNGSLGCKSVTNNPPSGWFDEALGGVGTLRVSGWAKDPDTPNAAASVSVQIAGQPERFCLANVDRPNDVGIHGFDCTFSANAGTVSVCIRAVDTSWGGLADIGTSCRTALVR
jgi:hypothetical protein